MSWFSIMDKTKYKKPKRNLNFFINKNKFEKINKDKKPNEYRHACIHCGKQWCKCHHNIRYRYPGFVPDNYDPRNKGDD